ncbi:MAG: beta-propeller fold lactonase family protein, partial [Pygmaiobacter massiliensis]|nr:beta-propeller fold lactonase family protein [Pygmaiobacter massiliensis]
MATNPRYLISGYSQNNAPDLALVEWTGEKLQTLHSVYTGENPSYVLKKGKELFVAHEVEAVVVLSKWRIEKDQLTLLGRSEFAFGSGLCHLWDTGNFLVGSCWNSGHFFAVDYNLQSVLWQDILIENERKAPHAHACGMLNQDVLICCDMGMDALLLYTLQSGIPQKESCFFLSKDAGPRQMIPLPNNDFLVVCETTPQLLLCHYKAGSCRQKCAVPLGKAGEIWPGGACTHLGDSFIVPLRGAPKIAQAKIEKEKIILT